MAREENVEEKEPFLHPHSAPNPEPHIFGPRSVIIGQSILIVMLMVLLAMESFDGSYCDKRLCIPKNHVYSPAQNVISYKNYDFMGSSGNQRTMYQGRPSPEIDKAWDDLYRYAINKIPKEEARLLENKTVPVPGEPGYYVVGLDVFHQLHCLNMIRKRVWFGPTLDEEEDEYAVTHIEHCMDTNRQYLMCTSDVSPVRWKWNYEEDQAQPIASIYHTCRDFDAVYNWAKDHLLDHFNYTIFVEDDLLTEG